MSYFILTSGLKSGLYLFKSGLKKWFTFLNNR